VPLCVVDDERSIAGVSRFASCRLRVPDLRTEAGTMAALDAARARFGLHGWVLYPTRDETVAFLSARREELGRFFRVPTPSWECVRNAWDKRRTYRLAHELSIPVPRTWFPRAEADLDQVDGRFPLLVKPAIKEHFFYATGAKAWPVQDRAGLLDAFRRARAVVGAGDEVLVQEMIPGGGDAQYAYCAFFRDGEPVASMTVARRRQHPSDLGRASTFVETVSLPAIEEPSTRFLRSIGYYGLVELEYKLDARDGLHKLLDVNARTWGYHGLGPASGVDFPYLLYRDQVGRPVDGRVRSRDGVRWVRLATDVPNALRDLRAGGVRPRDYLRSLRGVDTEAVFSLRDPLPGLYEVALLPYLALRRGL
jgi:predicted ATP-grasp superfamily ATP-dependent carboligase